MKLYALSILVFGAVFIESSPTKEKLLLESFKDTIHFAPKHKTKTDFTYNKHDQMEKKDLSLDELNSSFDNNTLSPTRAKNYWELPLSLSGIMYSKRSEIQMDASGKGHATVSSIGTSPILLTKNSLFIIASKKYLVFSEPTAEHSSYKGTMKSAYLSGYISPSDNIGLIFAGGEYAYIWGKEYNRSSKVTQYYEVGLGLGVFGFISPYTIAAVPFPCPHLDVGFRF